MGKNKLCIVCGSTLRLEAQKDPAYGIGARSEISGRTIREMINGIFLSDEELQYILGRPPQLESQQDGGHQNSFMTGVFPSNPEYGPGVCNTCFNLLEQIEAFEMNLNRTKSDLVQRRERRVSINGTKSYKNEAKRLNSTSNNGTTYNDNKAQLLSQLPPSTKVETILKTEPLDPEVQNHASGSQSYISSGSGEVGTEFFNDIEAPGSVTMPGASAMHALEDDDFLLNSIQPVGGSQGYHQNSHASHNNIKKEVDIYNEYQPWQPQKRDPDEAFFYGDGSEFDGVGFPDNSYDPDYKQWKVDYPTKSKRGRRPLGPDGGRKHKKKNNESPLSDLEVLIMKPDALLKPGVEPVSSIISRMPQESKRGFTDEIIQNVIRDFESDLEFLATKMPREITDLDSALQWDIELLKSETDVLLCGMPGELTCFMCQETFKTVVKKIIHVIKKHYVGTSPYQCKFCENLEFKSEEAIYNHLQQVHPNESADQSSALDNITKSRDPIVIDGDSRFFCASSGAVSTSLLSYWYHWWTRHKKYNHMKCLFCDEIPGTATGLRRHILINHFGYKFKYRDFETESVDEIKQHLETQVDQYSDDPKSKYSKKRQLKETQGNRVKVKKEEGIVDDDDEFSSGPGRKGKDSKSYWSKRSQQSQPLTIYERATVNTDQYLSESNKSEDALKLVPHLRQDLDDQHKLISQMPDSITSLEVAQRWDIALLKMETTKFTFGIPGECICFHCNNVLRSVPEKHIHIISLHGSGEQGASYQCTLCNKFWSSEETAFNHAKSKHFDTWQHDKQEKREPIILPGGLYQCKYCSITATTEVAFWTHTFLRHKRYKQIRCEMCGQLCVNAPQFRRHVLIHHGEYRYKCFECPKTFRPVESFKNHIKEHERQKKLVEYEKRKAERIAAGLPEHDPDDLDLFPEPVMKRSKKAPAEFVTCELCGKESRGERFHAKHMYTQHGMEMKMDCTDCGRTCASVRDLENHRRQEHCVASCHLCGKPFFSQNHLSVHLKQVHDIGQKEDEYICEMCARSFPTKAYLKIHMRTHNDKHIKCTLCTKMFRWESALKSHLAAAHAQTAGLFNCEFCGKQFKDKSNLKSHRYTHLDVKPHSCSKCGRGFIRRDMMLTHEKNCRL